MKGIETMEKCCTFFVILVALSCWFSVAEAQTVRMPDDALAAVVRDELGLVPDAPITRQAMQRLTFLDAQSYRIREITGQGGQIENLTGLEHATQLTRLWLNNNRIRDIGILSRLARLEELGIWNNEIRDIGPLSGLRRLRVLGIADNPIDDLGPLRELAQLEELTVSVRRISDLHRNLDLAQLDSLSIWGSGDEINDLRLLSNLKQLRRLEVRRYQVRDLGFVSGLTQLESLYLSGNEIGDLESAAGLTQLRHLGVSHSQVRDLGFVSGLTQLESLYLEFNEISDLKPLAGLTQLESLYLGFNEISDLKPLAGLTRLRSLGLRYNDIRDVSPLASLVNLESLYLGDNPIQDASPLASLTKLRWTDIDIPEPPRGVTTEPAATGNVVIPDANLAKAVRKALGLKANAPITKQAMRRLTSLEARESQIKNLTGLEHATQLTDLRLYKNQIRNISPLAGLTRLKRLGVDDNQISNINPLAGLTQLELLHIGANQINNQDVQRLSNLTRLRWLSLYGNQISNIKPLENLTKLEGLWLERNQISDVSPLAGLTNLKTLDIRTNSIRDISPLAGLTNLTDLKLKGNPIQDTSPLASLPKLREVDIEISQPAVVVAVGASERPPMYWINMRSGTLHRLVGDEVENLVPTVKNATSLTVDMAGGKLYWTERTDERTGRIRRANLDSTNVQLVKNLTSVPLNIALDPSGGKIYLTNAWGKVQRFNVDGSNFQPNLITDLDTPGNLVLDVTGGKVYWTETTGTSGRIRRANLDGSRVQNVATDLTAPLSLAVAAGKVYWTSARRLYRANPNGTNRGALETLPIAPTSIAFDPARNSLYLTSPSGGIYRRNLNDIVYQPVVTNLVSPSNIVLDISGTPPVPTDTPTPPAEPARDITADVNQDKKVNKTDLLLVVTALGESPPANPNFDVNADGTVNIADVLLVIEALDDPVAAAAPTLGEILTSLDPTRLAIQIDILRAESDGSLRYEHAIAFFQSLLAAIRPSETQLLANYPNPFNPETWIPYQLVKSGDVKITIYDARGIVVRRLELGYRQAGYYTNRSRAAYWDGKNEVGESVTSGIYFYQLEMDGVSMLRKMVVLK